MPFSKTLRGVSLRSAGALLLVSSLAFRATEVRAQESMEAPVGIAWEVRGLWQVDGKGAPIRTGDAMLPGSLLQPDDGVGAHSIIVLLPDGQRILNECFTTEDCARGFRVPPFYRRPDPFAVDLLVRVRTVLASHGDVALSRSAVPNPFQLARQEVVAELGPDNRVSIAGLAGSLPNGRYTYTLRSIDPKYPRKFHLVIEKKEPSLNVPLPSSGLYVLTIADDLNTPRIDLFIAAVGPAQTEQVKKSFDKAKALMAEWDDNIYGWPVHDLQRAYLESLMSAKPLAAESKANLDGKIPSNAGATLQSVPPKLKAGGQSAAAEMHRLGVTAEPTFSPKAGEFDGDTAVTLRCETPGATIHFTVDGSQPVASSPSYGAPIMLKGGDLTIKSFATASGRKDSAVVTGTFRIRE